MAKSHLDDADRAEYETTVHVKALREDAPAQREALKDVVTAGGTVTYDDVDRADCYDTTVLDALVRRGLLDNVGAHPKHYYATALGVLVAEHLTL